eukprot:s3073_g3.t1
MGPFSFNFVEPQPAGRRFPLQPTAGQRGDCLCALHSVALTVLRFRSSSCVLMTRPEAFQGFVLCQQCLRDACPDARSAQGRKASV